MALVFTQADLDALKAAYVTGATRVRIGDREVEYRSTKDLLAAMQTVQDYLTGATANTDNNPTMIKAGYARKQRVDE